MKDIFAAIGAGFTVYSFVYLIGMLVVFICEKIKMLRKEYKIKHKFDKPPAAKCYCIDCKYRTKYEECCVLGGCFKVADNWFCWKAEPKD